MSSQVRGQEVRSRARVAALTFPDAFPSGSLPWARKQRFKEKAEQLKKEEEQKQKEEEEKAEQEEAREEKKEEEAWSTFVLHGFGFVLRVDRLVKQSRLMSCRAA